MVSILCIGDPHFKIDNVIETELMVSKILLYVGKIKPDFVVVLGDILDRHESIHVSPLTRSINFLFKLKQLCYTFVLIGNHDLKNNRQFLSDEHPFTSLKYWEGIKIVDFTTEFVCKNERFIFVPYVQPGRFSEALSKIESFQNAKCIFAHQEFKGCKMGALISTEGDEWDIKNPFVVSGHIHDFQTPQTNILYTGTPIQHSFGDNHQKTISHFIFNDNDKVHERIDLKLPRKMIVRLNVDEVSTYIPDKNSQIKIIISGSVAEIKGIKEHQNIKDWRKQNFKICFKESSKNIETEFKPKIKYSQLLYEKIRDDQNLQRVYVELFGTPDNNFIRT